MPDDQNIAKNQDSTENPLPISPQEPMADIPIHATDSTPVDMPPEAPEFPKNADIPVSLNNPNLENEPVLTPSPEEAKPEELPAEGGKSEEIPEPVQTPETRTAQIPVNEPLKSEDEPLTQTKAEATPPPVIQTSQPKISLARELLVKARNMIQFRKRKKLDRVMTLFLKKSKITNDEVREFLHVSDATAERYLNTLEKENRIKQVGKTGKGVSYSRI